jgi:hypothetical protein
VLTIDKRFEGGLNASLDYTYQIARGSASDPQEARNALAGGQQAEVQLTALGWDQRHTLNTTVSYSPGVWGVSAIAQYGSGTPFTPRSSTDISTTLTNSQLKPQTFNLDIRGHYEFNFSSTKLVAFVRLFNVTDARNETNVFNDSGRAGFTTDEARAQATNPSERINTIKDFFTVPTNYSEPRRLEFGLNVEL